MSEDTPTERREINLAALGTPHKSYGPCMLCDKEVTSLTKSKHHLTPKQFRTSNKTDENTIILHKLCHTRLHKFFTIYELGQEYVELEKLKEEYHERLKYVSKCPVCRHGKKI